MCSSPPHGTSLDGYGSAVLSTGKLNGLGLDVQHTGDDAGSLYSVAILLVQSEMEVFTRAITVRLRGLAATIPPASLRVETGDYGACWFRSSLDRGIEYSPDFLLSKSC